MALVLTPAEYKRLNQFILHKLRLSMRGLATTVSTVFQHEHSVKKYHAMTNQEVWEHTGLNDAET